MMSRSLAAVFVLLACGAAAADYFVTDIVDAAKRGDGHAVRKLLEIDPEVVGASDAAGYTALHWAGIRAHWRIFAELLDADPPVNAVGGDGGTPLHWACHHDRADMIQLLIDAGADIEVHNRWGRAPLHVTARRGCREVAALLLARGADPNSVTKEGWTPLHVAYLSGQDDLVELLLANGADPDVTDESGKRPVDLGRERPAEIALSPSALEDYVGIYDLGGGFTAKVWLENEQLQIREFAPDGLYTIAADTFFCRQEPWKVRFVRDASGEVASAELHFLRRTITGTKTTAPRYVGSQACRDCHLGGEHGNQYVPWLRSRHAHAYWRLGSDWSLFLAKLRPHYHDLEAPIEDERCILCHVSGAQDPDSLFADTFRKEEGVSCEACHGPGSEYMDVEIMSNRESFLAAGGVVPDEKTCRACHRNSDRFDWATWSPKIEH